MFCPPGFRRFDELAAVCFDYGYSEVEANAFKVDKSARDTNLESKECAAYLCGHLALDAVIQSEILDPHFINAEGNLLRVSAYLIFETVPSLGSMSHADYWENRFNRFMRFNVRNGLVDISEGVARRDYCIGPPEDGSIPTAPDELKKFLVALNGSVPCFPEQGFPETSKELEKLLGQIRRRRGRFHQGQIARKSGRPNQTKSAVQHYFQRWEGKHSGTWEEAARKMETETQGVIMITGETLRKAVRKGEKAG